jgi:hypothetical protein
MAKVYGKIGSLTSLIDKLNDQGVYSFNSLRDIYDFKINYEDRVKKIKGKKKIELAENISDLQEKLKTLENKLAENIIKHQELLLKEKQKLETSLNKYKEGSKDIFYKIFNYYRNILNQNRYDRLAENFDYELNNPFEEQIENISNIKKEIADKESNCGLWIEKLSQDEYKTLVKDKTAIEDNKQMYFGAIGEDRALRELKKLPDTYFVINDFQKKFDTPIPDRKNDDKIFSAQVDHIVVGSTGIYLIETKNWSKASVANRDFFSPVKQLQRLSLAIFVLLNKPTDHRVFDSFNQGWGVTKISTKNILLMMHNKPNHEFQYVKILSLDEINRFITNSTPIFSSQQVEEIVDYLTDIGNIRAA